jgi:hypothetical protein
MFKVIVSREHCQIVTKAKLSQEGINRSNLLPGAPTNVSQLGGSDVIIAIRHDERHRGKPIQNLRTGPWTRKTLKKLLQDKPGR